MKHHYPGCELGDRCNCDAIDEELEQTIDEPMPTPTTPTHSYRILRDNKTKPVRYIVLVDGKIYVEGVTQAVAREIVAGHMMMTDPDLGSHQAITREFINSSGI